MAWWNAKESDLPESVRNMKPEELVSAIEKSKKVDTLESDLNEAKTKLSEFDSVKDRLAAMELKTKTPPTTRTEPTRPTSFLENEDQAFNERMAPFAIAMMNNQGRVARDMAKNQLAGPKRKMWEKFESEIDETMKSVDLSYHGQPETWIRAFNSVVGTHIDDVTKAASDKSDFFSESESGGGSHQPAPPDNDKIEAEDERIMKAMGLTPDQYKTSRKDMVVRG